ncbi:hypothetical protein DB32_007178 [Sandaracinus amylolyticus]|uniref:Uncharacterized protein n=1 Tax=Sandaracinus amylolyticus TaxID=927083 RepID=A0A0F6SH90_9BACT|nr:hypothetical protein DB32_007178 [Sandaracinus amylolyticus]
MRLRSLAPRPRSRALPARPFDPRPSAAMRRWLRAARLRGAKNTSMIGA